VGRDALANLGAPYHPARIIQQGSALRRVEHGQLPGYSKAGDLNGA
jgi:hypothetical protein